jgi:hypothetical protein
LQGDHVQQKAIVVAQACCYNPEPEPDYDSNEGDEYESDAPTHPPYKQHGVDEYDSDKPSPKPYKPEEHHKGHSKPHHGNSGGEEPAVPPTYGTYGQYVQQQGTGAGVPILGAAQAQAGMPLNQQQGQKLPNFRAG